MVEKTCAACDCKLEEHSIINVRIGGQTVEVCCDECAQKLKEAYTNSAKAGGGQQSGISQTFKTLFTITLFIGFIFSSVLLINISANAQVIVSARGNYIMPNTPNENSFIGERKKTAVRRNIRTASGSISYLEQGTGPVALFVHGVLLNSYLWRNQLANLSDIRRCIAVDLLAHGATEISPDQDVSVTANAKMLKEFLDALNLDKVDLVGNDSGGGISQIFAAMYPERVRSLTLTNCDTHDNWPPEAFKPFLSMAAAGGLRGTIDAMLADKNVFRSTKGFGPAYEHPEKVTDDSIEIFLRPLIRTEQHTHNLQRFLAEFDNKHTIAIESQLKKLKAPTLIVWGTDDVFFDVKWSQWLADTIPGTRRRIEFKGARIFFPEERWQEFNKELRSHWEIKN